MKRKNNQGFGKEVQKFGPGLRINIPSPRSLFDAT